LGEGELDMNAILQALNTINYTGWIAVELDAYHDPKAGAEISMRYLTEFERTQST
jgi:inosose dehydratase